MERKQVNNIGSYTDIKKDRNRCRQIGIHIQIEKYIKKKLKNRGRYEK